MRICYTFSVRSEIYYGFFCTFQYVFYSYADASGAGKDVYEFVSLAQSTFLLAFFFPLFSLTYNLLGDSFLIGQSSGEV